ncbi:hypothetical protein FA13DRAFT_1668463 [Coprinellus micaceus]|uniref:CHAT domain-containing protein n=1 Tax=Coprinellus micaceus TaxID=71717 RepID=A0A4Y7SVE2_COPMI|nr:hypothetical protein FA13DRAFT_1668463 [Coprinellus micaceus]
MEAEQRQQYLNISPEIQSLGGLVTSLLRRSTELTDIAEALLQIRAMDLSEEQRAQLPSLLSALAYGLMSRSQSAGDPADLDTAISLQRRALDMTPAGHPNLPGYLSSLGGLLCLRFESIGDLADITHAISSQRRALALTPGDRGDRPSLLSNMGRSLQSRFERTGDMTDLVEAISLQRRALDLAQEGYEDLPIILTTLGIAFCLRFERAGDLSDLTESILMLDRSVDMTPEGDEELPFRLDRLGGAFSLRFSHRGDIADITKAIAWQRRAVELTSEGHVYLPSLLTSLGDSFHARFEHTGEVSDIVAAITLKGDAIHRTPLGHSDLPSRLSSLGNSFCHRFQCTGDSMDLIKAICFQSRAVGLTPEDDTGLPSRLSHLGSSFLSRFENTDDVSDLSEAISLQQRAVDLTPEGHTELPARLSSLGRSLSSLFEKTGEPGDMEAALSAHQNAIQLAPPDHGDIVRFRFHLATTWYKRFVSSGISEHLDASIGYFQSAVATLFGRPRSRFAAAKQLAQILNRHRPHSPDVLGAFETAVRLMTLVAGLEQTVRIRFATVEGHAQLPLEAAATAFRHGQPDKALEWLEQGRCLVWGQQSRLRTPLAELRDHDPILAERVSIISRQLEGASSARSPGPSAHIAHKLSIEDGANNHLHIAREWDALLTKVRDIPGFEAFLQPSPASAIVRYLPESGPVLIINISKDQCDAVALLAGLDEPMHIHLPLFSFEKASKYRRALDGELRSGGMRASGAYFDTETDAGVPGRLLMPQRKARSRTEVGVRSVLEGLWKEVVKPVLDSLGISKGNNSSKDRLPRIWWCPTGPLSFLPLHAAGVYGGSNAESIMDYAVSSYTPTVAALSERIKTNRLVDERVSGLFLTCQPNAASALAIPGTTNEVLSIYKELAANGIRSLKLEGEAVTADECLEYMGRYSSIHLACHASQNATEPLQSRFLFHKGTLGLNTIMQRDLKNADLAFLSACETSTGQETLSDEAVHLAAGMLAAGYRGVVATMWSIDDQHAPSVANDFYEYLLSGRRVGAGSRFDGTLSARALHHATQRLRERLDNSDKSLLAWIPYVHWGY